MRYKLTLCEVSRKRAIQRQTVQQRLLADIREALRYKRYTSATTGQERNFAPHQLNAAMEAITPVVERYMRVW
jgi:hypothetical protein